MIESQEEIPEKIKPVLLVVLDGWGIAPPSRGNAISLAKTPYLDHLIKTYPSMTLQASGESVGLSWGEIGNSEVGHLNIGSGKLVYQNLPKINKAITGGEFFTNEKFNTAINSAKKNKGAIHLMGLLSTGGVHGSVDHLYALLDLCVQKKIKKVFIHLFLDGRDMPYNSGRELMAKLQDHLKEIGVGQVASIAGRFYAMDRDNHWERTVLAYKAIAEGVAENQFADPLQAIDAFYDKKIYDEEMVPTVIARPGKPTAVVVDGDSIIFFNFRSDRARQLTRAFVSADFDKFPVQSYNRLYFVTMTEYEKDLPANVAFGPDQINNPLAKIISDLGMSQLHVAETEKYAHVTFFFNGGREEKFPGEDRILVPSLRVASYARQPEMSAKEITKKTAEAIMIDKYNFIVLNFANGDMVAHTGDMKATIKALEFLDGQLKKLSELVLAKDGTMLITADHGNAEEVMNLQSGTIDKEHSTHPVPFIIVGKQWEGKTAGLSDSPNSDLSLVKPSGLLSDIAPTVLKIMGIAKPDDMDGNSLI